MRWLHEEGYTHCFYVAGGNVMYLLEAASHIFTCIPFVHEVGAAVATDYFNESGNSQGKAFLLVTAGPGLTNAMTGIVGAWTESREMLIIGGQSKSSQVSRGKYRQIGFQEIDGVGLCAPVTKLSRRLEERISRSELAFIVSHSWTGRKGPVFLEVCLDVTTQPALENSERQLNSKINDLPELTTEDLTSILTLLKNAKRPVILIGGGVSRETSLDWFKECGLPLATTFNGTDRVGSEYIYYAGRPNWYGSRWANLLIQQSDFIIALGTRLGIMQVGYNWEGFAPNAKIVQIDIDEEELSKGFPKTEKTFCADANTAIRQLGLESGSTKFPIDEWREFVALLRADFAEPEKCNKVKGPYLEAMNFVFQVMVRTNSDDTIVPSSSGAAAYEGAMRVLLPKLGQTIITSHALASMGIGLSGAIGASLSKPSHRTILFEGDGGFAQNYQELGTVRTNSLNLKIFLMDNQGYQSIRGNQKSAFNSHYVGCDRDTGLFLPDWIKVAESYEINVMELDSNSFPSKNFSELFENDEPTIFVVRVDPNQTYWPRHLSSKAANGSIISSPLHLMNPPLAPNLATKYLKYL